MTLLKIIAVLTGVALASPVEEKRWLNCNAVRDIVTVLHEQRVATPFCSSLLSIPTITRTMTQTSTPPCVTVTQSTSSVQTITTVSSATVYGTTTVYPVVAVSTTSTCEVGATYIPTSSANPTRKFRRDPPPPGSPPPPPPSGPASSPPPPGSPGSPPPPPAGGPGSPPPATGAPPPPPTGPTPIARPTCLSKFVGSAISSACSCLSIPTPTKVSVTTTTLPAKTVSNTS